MNKYIGKYASSEKKENKNKYRGYYMPAKYFSTFEEKFRISKRPCDVLFII